MPLSGKKAGIIVVVIIVILFALNYWYYMQKQQRTLDNIRTINNIRNIKNNGSVQGFANLSELQASPFVTQIQQLNQDPPTSDNIFYYFTNPDCGYCKKFNDQFNAFLNKIQNANIPNLTIAMIDVNDPKHSRLVGYYNIRNTPTLILATPEKIIEYDGQRTPDSLYNFIATNINQPQ